MYQRVDKCPLILLTMKKQVENKCLVYEIYTKKPTGRQIKRMSKRYENYPFRSSTYEMSNKKKNLKGFGL